MKRKIEESEDSELKRQRREVRSTSDPQPQDKDSMEKRTALKRLFGRICSVELKKEPVSDSEDSESESVENEDPLLDSVPVDMDPEQLGFLVCAQETLRFLHRRGMSVEHPMFAKLRSRFLKGIDEMGIA